MHRGIALGLLGLWLLTGCGLFGIGSSRKTSSGRRAGGALDAFALTRKKAAPCSSFLVINSKQTRIEGIWLTNRALPFKMRVGGNQRMLPGLRDVSEILLVLDDWRVTACKSKVEVKTNERVGIEQKLARVDDYLRAFTLILSTPYSTAEEAETEIRRWVKEVRDRLLTELLRRAG